MTKIEAIAEKAAEILRAQIVESAEGIEEAWQTVIAENEGSETSPVMGLGFSIKLNLDKDAMTCVLGYSVRRKVEFACQIPDPNQPDLIKN